MKKTNEQIASRVLWVTIAVNTLLTAGKMLAGIISHSGAMVSDAVHSLSDVLSTVIVMIGIKFANKESDADHQYGHERMESVAALLLAIMLCATGVGIGYAGVTKIFAGNYSALQIPGMLALVAAVVSIVVKEGMYWYTRWAAKKINSSAMLANAWHHRTDALSSIGSFAGILGARLGFPVLDSVASVIICVFIVKVAVDIFLDAISKMTDKSCNDETVKKIRYAIASQDGVLNIDQVKTRLFGDKIYVDVEIEVDGSMTLNAAHDIAQNVHDAVEASTPGVKHCMVHVNPYTEGEE